MAHYILNRLSRFLETCSWHRPPLVLTYCVVLLVTPLAWKKLTYKPNLLDPPPKDYNYQLHLVAQAGSAVLDLPDGRKIGYAQYGDITNGKPIITLHGILGSRLESALFDTNAKELGIRIIGVERPGMGLSSPDSRPLLQRRILDHALRDVEPLATHLELKEYAVLGTSGGGPYALGCAFGLPPSQLKAVAVVTGLGLHDMSQPWHPALVFLQRHLHDHLRWLLKWMFTSSPVWNFNLGDDERMEAMRKGLDTNKAHPADADVAKQRKHPDWAKLFLYSSREALRQGHDGFLDDAQILSKEPGFRVEDIRPDLPVQLWCGTDDTNVSPQAGEEIAQRLRASGNNKIDLHMKKGETHGSVQVKFQRKVLQDLLAAMDSEKA